jgi:hypothetical protein
LYYLQSRYYNPKWGRFINADSYTSIGQGLLGNNMFIYCLNNPVNKADSTGTKPYDLFDSADEAAVDFAECYNAASIRDKQEYGSAIFKYTYKEIRSTKRTFTIYIFGRPLNFSYYTTEEVWVSKYYYNRPAIGSTGAGVFPNFLGFGIIVSTVHTHANYDPNYNNDDFSKKWLWK